MNKIIMCVFVFILQGHSLCLDKEFYFGCSSENFCDVLFFSGCSEDWKLDSIIIRSLDMQKIWSYQEPHNIINGLSVGTVGVNLKRNISIFLEVYSNYGIWIKKMRVDDPYDNQSQYIPNEE